MDQQLDSYVIQSRLAPALFGDVLLCEHRPTSQQVAVKRVLLSAAAARKTLASHKLVLENVAFERELYNRFRARGGHRNVMGLRDEIEFDGYLYLVFDYCARGELYDLVRRSSNGRLALPQAQDFITQIARGVQFMHQNNVAHRDLSLENILLTDSDVCKVSDFGLAAPADALTSETVGKKFYMAPEVVAGAPYDPTKADVWSLGVMLFIMLIGAPPVDRAVGTDARFKMIQAHGLRHLIDRWGMTQALPAEAIDLLVGTLQIDPAQRMSMRDIIAHPFLLPTPVMDELPDGSTFGAMLSISPDPTSPRPQPDHVFSVREKRLASTLQDFFRRSSKRRTLAVPAASSTAAPQRYSTAATSVA